jgi:hypothetical protein
MSDRPTGLCQGGRGHVGSGPNAPTLYFERQREQLPFVGHWHCDDMVVSTGRQPAQQRVDRAVRSGCTGGHPDRVDAPLPGLNELLRAFDQVGRWCACRPRNID